MLKIIIEFLIKIIFRTFKRILVIAFILLLIMLSNRNVTILEIYTVILLVLLSIFSSLKAKDNKENWKHFFIPIAGYDRLISLYVYVLTILFANLLMIIFGITCIVLYYFNVYINDLSILVGMFVITNMLLFYYLSLLFISEFLQYEHLLILQKILVLLAIFIFISLKNTLGNDPFSFYYSSYLFLFVLLFNYIFIFVLHEVFIKRRSVFK